MTAESDDEVHEALEDRLGIEEAVVDKVDPTGLSRALTAGLSGALGNPLGTSPLGKLELAGEHLVASAIDQPTYIVAAIEDHIVPWQASYQTTRVFKGEKRFVLSSAGHIAGIVNPPSPKSRLWLNDELPEDAEQWRAGAVEHHDTWWNDWAKWITLQAGELIDPPGIGGNGHEPLCDAPGTYVLG